MYRYDVPQVPGFSQGELDADQGEGRTVGDGPGGGLDEGVRVEHHEDHVGQAEHGEGNTDHHQTHVHPMARTEDVMTYTVAIGRLQSMT